MKYLVGSVALCAVLCSGVALAQETTGAIVGTVTSEDGAPLPGVSIQLEDTERGLSRSAVSAANGGYSLVALPPARYQLTATLDKFQTVQRAVKVDLGRTVTNDMEMKVGAVTDTIEVTGATPLVDVTSNVSGLTVDTDQLTGLMPLARDVTRVAMLAPGTVAGDSWFENGTRSEFGTNLFTPGQSLTSMGGASVAENLYVVNGLNTTNFSTGLGSTFVPIEFVEQLQVKTGGYEAEYGRSTGGVINMVTKSGTNAFRGSASIYFRPQSLQEQQPDTYFAPNQDQTIEEREVNASVGGPLVRDHLFFFAFLRHWQKDALDLLNDSGQRLEVAQPYYGGKIDWNLAANHRLEATYLSDRVTTDVTNHAYDLETRTLGLAGNTGTQNQGGDNYIAKYTGILSPSFLLSAQYGANDFDRTEITEGDACPYVWDVRGGDWVKLGCWVVWNPGAKFDGRTAGRIDADWYLGKHSLRGGLDAEGNTTDEAVAYSGGIFYRYYDGDDPTGEYPYELLIKHGEFSASWDVNSRAAYIQDNWAVTPSLTLNLGLRYEEFENKNALGDTFLEITNQWGPRLGAVWDPSGQGRSKIYGSYGLYYLPLGSSAGGLYANAWALDEGWFQWSGELNSDGSPAGYNDCGYFNLATCGNQGSVGDYLEGDILADGTVPDPRETISTNFDPMSQWELILGYEQMVGSTWSVGARFVNREFNDAIDDFCIDQPLEEVYGVDMRECRLGNPGKAFEGWVDLDGDGELDPVTLSAEEMGLPDAIRKYYAVELIFNRRFAGNWMLQGSYTWSKLYGNYEGPVLSDNGQFDANTTIMFDHRGLMEHSSGNLQQDRRHNLKVFGAYAWDFGLQIGANAGWRTGRPINSFGVHPTDFYAQTYGASSFYTVGVPKPRGSSGTTDDVGWLDIMLKYDFRWGVDWFVRLDVFNLFNMESVTEVQGHAEQDSSNPPNYVLNPNYGLPRGYQSPRSVRFGVGLSF